VTVVPFFWLLDTKNTYLIWIAIFIAQAIAGRGGGCLRKTSSSPLAGGR
jgi:hypothetical protein